MNEVINKLKQIDGITSKKIDFKNKEYDLFYILELIDNNNLFKILSNLSILDINNISNIIEETNNKTFDNLYFHLTIGDAILINSEDIFYLKVSSIPKRTITESQIDPVNLFGSKEGLIEDINTNYALIQKRIHANKLKYTDTIVGNVTKCKLRIMNIEGFIDNNIVEDIYNKINEIDIKSIRTINDITKYFSKNSLFPQVLVTSSVEVIINSLMNGRVILLIEGFPNALILPVSILEFTNLPDEASCPKYYLFYTRILTFFLMFLSIFQLGLYIAIINFHSHVLSMQLVSEIITSQKGSTFPLIAEVIFVMFIFEFLRIASSKTPTGYVQNLVITVGGLLIGQNTVNSGYVSPFNLVIIALSYLASFGITNNKHLIITFNYLRIIIVFSSYFFGILGFMISSIIIINILMRLNLYNVDYISFINKKEIKNIFDSNYKQKDFATR